MEEVMGTNARERIFFKGEAKMNDLITIIL